MITLFTGMPGAGKTAALVDLLSKLEPDRPLYVDGLNGLTLDHIPVDAHEWPSQLPDGSILVIDEAQRVWRPRGPGAKVPDDVAALETHRHRGIDIYLTTQAPRLIDANVRGLVGRHVHIRDTGWLGRHWYEWPETNDGMMWKSCPNKKSFKLPKKAFGLYKSASLHTVPVRMTPMAYYISIFFILAAVVGAFLVYRLISKHSSPSDAQSLTDAKVKSDSVTPSVVGIARSGDHPLIDDRLDFIPRVSNKPESAPAYDQLRVIVQMPIVAGGFCTASGCLCITQQGSNPGLSPAECRAWIENRPFYPYAPTLAGDGNSLADTRSSAIHALPSRSVGEQSASVASPFGSVASSVEGKL